MSNTERKQQILDAAEKRFAHYGYKRTVIDDIVSDVGLAKGSFYLYFKSKEDIFRRVIDRNRMEVLENIRHVVGEDDSPTDKLRRLVRTFVRDIDNFPVLSRFIARDPDLGLPPEMAIDDEESCRQRHLVADEALGGLIAEGIRRGEFRGDIDTAAAVSIIVSFFHIHIHNRRHHFVKIDIETFMEQLLDILFDGIRSRTQSGPICME